MKPYILKRLLPLLAPVIFYYFLAYLPETKDKIPFQGVNYPDSLRQSPKAVKTPPAWLPAVPLPAWATPAEKALLERSMVSWKYSVGMCDGCSAYQHKRIISPSPTICAFTAKGKSPDLLLMVSTIHKHRVHRSVIRKTWGSHTQNNTGRVRLLFLFGKDPGGNLEDQQLLQKEGEGLGDILQDDFNSTYKRGGEVQLIMGYRWVVQHCPNISHILKVTDDVFVNVPKVLELITTDNLNNSVWGLQNKGAKPIRNRAHRYYISPEVWPAPVYPNYCSGAFIGTSLAVIRKILLISPYIAWSAGADDVIVGMCAEKLGIPTKHVVGFRMGNWRDPCKIPSPNYAVHLHGSAPDILNHFWMNRACFK